MGAFTIIIFFIIFEAVYPVTLFPAWVYAPFCLAVRYYRICPAPKACKKVLPAEAVGVSAHRGAFAFPGLDSCFFHVSSVPVKHFR